MGACGSDDGGGSSSSGGGGGTAGTSAQVDGGPDVGTSGAAGEGGAGGAQLDAGAGASGGTDAGRDGGSCRRDPADADRTRYVVVSHPFDASSQPSPAFSMLSLSSTGDLTPLATTFDLARTTRGEIAFTPDGKLGFAADEDGNVGVFALDSSGAATVVHAAYDGQFYASSVVVAPAGDTLYVLDTEFENIGGGIYALTIGCDGTLSNERLVVGAQLPAALELLPGDRAFVPTDDIAGTSSADDTYLLSWSANPMVLGSARAFPDDEAIISSAAVTADGQLALVADNSFFSSVPNRIAVVSIGAGALAPVQVLTPIEDPMDVATSPHDDAALVSSGFGDALFVLDYDPANAAAPFSIRGELMYTGDAPPLPGRIVPITRGALEGMVLVAQNTGVRRVRFDGNGVVTDLGDTDLGSGVDKVVGAIGITP